MKEVRDMFEAAFPVINEKITEIARNGFTGQYRPIEEVIKHTADRTKAILPLFDSVLQDAADHLGIDYSFVDAKGYDIIYGGQKIEQKLTGSKSASSFTGAAHQDESKFEADGFWLMRYELDGQHNRISKFALWQVPGLDKLPKTAEAIVSTGKRTRESGKSTFNTIRIHRDNFNDINCVFGDKKANKVWVKQILESV